jgi:hypothetical protein
MEAPWPLVGTVVSAVLLCALPLTEGTKGYVEKPFRVLDAVLRRRDVSRDLRVAGPLIALGLLAPSLALVVDDLPAPLSRAADAVIALSAAVGLLALAFVGVFDGLLIGWGSARTKGPTPAFAVAAALQLAGLVLAGASFVDPARAASGIVRLLVALPW